ALSRDGHFDRLLAGAQFELAAVYRAAGDLQNAEQIASEAVRSSQAGGEIYELPKRYQYLGQLKTAAGKYEEADAIYDRATDFVEAMVGSAPKVITKGALISAMGDIFNEHFALFAGPLNNVTR